MTGLECIGGPLDGETIADRGYRVMIALPTLGLSFTLMGPGDESQTIELRQGVYGRGVRWKRYGVRYLPIEDVYVWEGEK